LSLSPHIVFNLIHSTGKKFHWGFYLISQSLRFQNFNLIFFTISESSLNSCLISCSFPNFVQLFICIIFESIHLSSFILLIILITILLNFSDFLPFLYP
jgi:hypothetical protein